AIGLATAARLSGAINRTKSASSDRTRLGERTWVVVLSGAALTLRSLHATSARGKLWVRPMCRGRSVLAARTPVGHPLGGVVAGDAGAAATAILPGPPVDPQLPAWPGVARGAAIPSEAVSPQHVSGSADQTMRIGDVADRCGRQMPADETQFVAV